MKGITTACFGKTKKGETVRRFTLTNDSGASVSVLDWGCTLHSIRVPDRQGNLREVCLAWETQSDYEKNGGYLGATVGRYANRIARGRFHLAGQEYILACNDGDHHLHGGRKGFDKYIWTHAIKGESLIFSRVSPDGEEGYPGCVWLSVAFTLGEDNTLSITYTACSDRDTVLSLTNHAYFNLEGAGTVLDHTLRLCADAFTPVAPGLIPTGEIRPVQGTPFDFTAAKPLGRDIHMADEQLALGGGYDHNFCINGHGLRQAALLCAPQSGITLQVETDLPGVQVYTANVLEGSGARGGGAYEPRQAICLETQQYPDAVNQSNFPSPILSASQESSFTTIYRFGLSDPANA